MGGKAVVLRGQARGPWHVERARQSHATSEASSINCRSYEQGMEEKKKAVGHQWNRNCVLETTGSSFRFEESGQTCVSCCFLDGWLSSPSLRSPSTIVIVMMASSEGGGRRGPANGGLDREMSQWDGLISGSPGGVWTDGR
jgi:hypothetical protein